MPAVPSIPLPPKGLNIHESRQSQLYAAAITTYLLAVIAVCLRFWARRLLKVAFMLDDWLAAAATVGLRTLDGKLRLLDTVCRHWSSNQLDCL